VKTNIIYNEKMNKIMNKDIQIKPKDKDIEINIKKIRQEILESSGISSDKIIPKSRETAIEQKMKEKRTRLRNYIIDSW